MTIHISHLRKQIGKQTILNDISLDVERGEVVGLLGPNGAGKSTLMKVCTGIWDFDEGEVKVCGVDMKQAPHDVAEHIGYLPENNPLYEDMYIAEYLHFVRRMHHIKREERVEELIEMVGLMPERTKKIGQLSKGYRQRVGLAAALMGDPELLILDEPTTGLDPNQLDEIRALIRRLGADKTIILSTHILQEVKEMCNRVVILDHGKKQADIADVKGTDLEQLFREKTKH